MGTHLTGLKVRQYGVQKDKRPWHMAHEWAALAACNYLLSRIAL
jgi:hypothetical protein